MDELRPGSPSDIVLRFAEFEFDRDQGTLSRAGTVIPVEPKVLALIRFLLDQHGRVVGKEEILAAVWPDSVTTSSSLARAVSLARSALAADEDHPARNIIETVRGRGYRIAVPLRYVESNPGPPTAGNFVGRQAILENFNELLTRLAEGEGGMFLIRGEAGIGKTRLSEEVAVAARELGVEVLWGRCREGGGGPAYGPWTQLLRTYVSRRGLRLVRSEADADCEALADILPEFSSEADASNHIQSAGSARSLQLAAVERLLARASRFRSLLLIIEDLHCADEASHLLLRGLAELTLRHRIGFLISYRGDELSDSPVATETLLSVSRSVPQRVEVELEGLSQEETGLFIADRIAVQWSQVEIERMHERSDGSPFFLQELIRHRAEGSGRELPETLRLLLRSRFEGLGDELRALLRLASVMGREFRAIDLSHALDVSESKVLESLGEAESQRLVEHTGGIGGEFRFSHALVREALYDTLRSHEKRDLHERAGNTLAALYGGMHRPPLNDLARHFAEAGNSDRALRYSIAAAAQARKNLAFESAADNLRQALRVVSSTPPIDQEQECEILLDLGDVLHRSGRNREGVDSIKRAVEIARHIGAVEFLAQGACTLALWRDDNIGIVPTERIALLEEALGVLPLDDSPLRARVLTALSADLYWSDDFERSAALSEEAVEVAHRVNDPDATFIALYQRHDLLFGPEYGAEVDQINAESLSLAKKLRDVEYEFFARARIWERHVAKAEPTEIDQAFSNCAKLAERLRQPRFDATVESMRAARELWRGDLAAAKARLPDPQNAVLVGPSAIRSIALVPHMFLVLRMQGKLEQLEALARAGVEQFPHLFALRCALGLFCALTGRVDEANSILGDLSRNDFVSLRRDVNHGINLAVLAETVAGVRDRKLARALIDRLKPYAGRNMVAGAYMSLGCADRYLGLLATTIGDFDEAAEHFEDALKIETRMGAAPWRAWTERDYARMLVVRDRGEVGPEAKKRFKNADHIEAGIRKVRMKTGG